MPCASPKEATSTPSSFSLVDMSAPVKDFSGRSAPLARVSATATAISYPGATRPYTLPSQASAHSPIA